MPSLHWSSPLGRLVLGLGVFTFSFWALAVAAFFAWSPGRGVAMAAATRLAPRAVSASDAVATPDTEEDSCTSMCDQSSSYSYGYANDDEDQDDFAWAVLDAGNVMVIEGGEPDHVRAHARPGQPVFWFRDGDEEFWVTDRATVEEARRATARVQQLGQEMGKVGAEMGRHGAEMGRLGGRMGSLGARIAVAEARIATHPAGSRSEREQQREVLDELREQLSELQNELSTQQSQHARSQRELSKHMGELSAEHQKALHEARAKVREISVRARREGKAERPHANA